MRFPWFRMAYFILWTGIFVVFQWILHACVSMWWPYPFLDLSLPYSPVWYLCVALLHLPCYAIFGLIIKMKHFSLSRWFPESYQCEVNGYPRLNYSQTDSLCWQVLNLFFCQLRNGNSESFIHIHERVPAVWSGL